METTNVREARTREDERPSASVSPSGRVTAEKRLLALQRFVGNTSIACRLQRDAAGPRGPIGRPPASAAADTPEPQTSTKFSLSHMFAMTPAAPLGPIEFEGIEAEGELEWEPAEATARDAHGGAGTDAHVSSSGSVSTGPDAGADAGIEVTVEHAFAERVIDCKPKLTGGGKITTEAIEAGAEFELEGEHTSGVLHFELVEWKPGEPPKLGVAKYEVNGHWDTSQIDVPAVGRGSIKFTGKLTAVFTPNLKEIGEWISEQLGRAAGVELAFDGAIIVVGVATIAATAYEMAYGAEEGLAEMTAAVKARSDVRAYCVAYGVVIQGYAADNRERAADDGTQAAEKRLEAAEKATGVPKAALAEDARRSGTDFAMEVYAGVREQTRQALIERYKEEHKIMSAFERLFGVEDGGNLVNYFDQLCRPDRFPD